MFDYDEYASEAVKVLDRYDLREKICGCRETWCDDTYEVQQYVTDLFYHEGNSEAAEAMENLTLDEFLEYLAVRYGNDLW